MSYHVTMPQWFYLTMTTTVFVGEVDELEKKIIQNHVVFKSNYTQGSRDTLSCIFFMFGKLQLTTTKLVMSVFRPLSFFYDWRVKVLFVVQRLVAGFFVCFFETSLGPHKNMVMLTGHILTLWGRDKVVAILKTTFSNAFSWMKIVVLRFKFP